MSVLLKAEHFSFLYPGSDKKAIDDVSFELKKGEILLLCGASGSGKSTLLHSIKREISPVGERGGKFFLMGRDMDGLSREELTSSIAMVFQNPESQTVMDTVLSEMAFALENMGQKSADIRRKVSEVCGYFGLSDILHKSPHRISGGQRQMVNLCAALAIRPELILFDEPFSQLDPVAQNDLLTIIRRVNREFGITIMLSEHKTEELASVCDRLMFLDGGKISYFGEPHGVAKDMIQKDDRKALSFLPSPVRIYASLGGIPGEAPLSIREGREFIAPYVSRITLRKEENEPEKAEGKTALTADNLLFSYPDSARPVIKNLDLSIKCGDFCAIMGGNGSGKSTLLKLLCGLLAPQDGKIRIGGRDIAKMPREEINRRIFYIPQNPALSFTFDTVGGELDFAKEQGSGENFDGLIRDFGFDGLSDKHPYDLSGGEIQKLAVLCALMRSPDILLLDEATKGIDEGAKEELSRLFGIFAGKGKTIIMVSHDIEFTARNAGKFAILFDGALSEFEDRREFFRNCFFYTTAVSRMLGEYIPDAVSLKDLVIKHA